MDMSVDLLVFTDNERNRGTFTNSYVKLLTLKQSQIIFFASGHTPCKTKGDYEYTIQYKALVYLCFDTTTGPLSNHT